MTRINIEKIASKMQMMRGQASPGVDALLADPRYLQTLCFVEAMSHLPGGLEKFCADFIDWGKDWILTPIKSGAPFVWWWEIVRNNRPFVDERMYSPDDPAGRQQMCMSAEVLASWLRAWCETPNAELCLGWRSGDDGDLGSNGDACFDLFFIRYPGFLGSMSAYMDRHAVAELAKTADTMLRRKVLFELDFAQASAHRIPVYMWADTRHGKTTAAETYCRAWPGKARLVEVSESNNEREFIGAYADAFRMDWTPNTSCAELKSRVQYVQKQVRPCIVHDEAQRLIPVNYHQQTPPKRIDWVRARIVDQHLPSAFLCTEQSHAGLRRYANKTHHNMEQWLGRLSQPIHISDKPSYDDLKAIVRNHFPSFSNSVVDELCDAAVVKVRCVGREKDSLGRCNGESGFKIAIHAGDRALYLANQLKLSGVNLSLIREGIEFAGGSSLKAVVVDGPCKDARAKKILGPAAASPGFRRDAADVTQADISGGYLGRETVPVMMAQ